jgi:hypothetical protein
MHPKQRKRWSCQLWLETVLGDFNAKVGKEFYLYPECGGHSLKNKPNVGGKMSGKFFTGKSCDRKIRTFTRSPGITWQQNM